MRFRIISRPISKPEWPVYAEITVVNIFGWPGAYPQVLLLGMLASPAAAGPPGSLNVRFRYFIE